MAGRLTNMGQLLELEMAAGKKKYSEKTCPG
jgi:hypothetical protein